MKCSKLVLCIVIGMIAIFCGKSSQSPTTPKMVAVGGTRIFYEKDNLAAKTYVQVPYSVINHTIDMVSSASKR